MSNDFLYKSVSSDIDECATNDHDCHADATCTDTTGSFACKCNFGYEGNGISCTAGYSCNPNADSWKDILDGSTCEKYVSFAYCTDDGKYGEKWNKDWGTWEDYAKDGFHGGNCPGCGCIIHPCDEPDNGGCDQTCVKEGKKAVCECSVGGFALGADGKKCDGE